MLVLRIGGSLLKRTTTQTLLMAARRALKTAGERLVPVAVFSCSKQPS